MVTLYDAMGNMIEISGGGGDTPVIPEINVAPTANDFLTGKTWLCIGDSISVYNGYHQMIAAKYNLTELTGAVAGGMCVSYRPSVGGSILDRLDGISEGIPDIITIALGTNDNGTTIGTINDDPNAQTPESYTFMGCYKALITRLFEKYGYVPMMLMTPYHRNKVNVLPIVEAIREIGEYYSIPVFDVYAESGLPVGTLCDSNNENHLFAPDGLHINPYGGAVSAPKIADKMNLVIQKWEFPATKLVGSGSSEITLTDTSEQTIYAYAMPQYTTDFNKIVWESSDTNVATITMTPNYNSAQLKAVSNGNCVVTATMGNFAISYNITVAL